MKRLYMFKLFTFTIYLLFLLYTSPSLSAQTLPKPILWGEVSETEKNLKKCDYEPDASAVVLSEYGILSVHTASNTPISLKKHRRIKILKEEGIAHADIKLRYYFNNKMELISNLIAQTINEEDGKLKLEPVKKDQIFYNQINQDWSEVVFTFPNVKVGSILEFQYTHYSKNIYHPDPWYFQDKLPILHSELFTSISGLINYKAIVYGQKLQKETAKDNIAGHWIMNNMPSIREEPYIWNYKDYAEKIEFQLTSYLKPNELGIHQEVFIGWKDIIKNYLGYQFIEKTLSDYKTANKILKKVKLRGKRDLEKIEILHRYINENFSWNKKLSIYPTQSIKDLLKTKLGNSADLNLFMVLLLREYGIRAYPALISTKKNGAPSENLIFINQFNNLVCAVKLKNKTILIDNRAKFHPYDLLDKINLNQKALIADNNYPHWITITPESKNIRNTVIQLNLNNSSSEVPGNQLSFKFNGYDAVDARKAISQDKGEDFIKEQLDLNQLSLNNITFSDIEDLSKPVVIKAEIQNLITWGEDMIYFTPMLINSYQDNPFKSDQRQLPIDLVYPHKDNYVMEFTIPEKYEILELPEKLQIKLPGNGGSFVYDIVQDKNKLQIISRTLINKTFFEVKEYPYLKEWFDLIREKHSEQIVLKKKE